MSIQNDIILKILKNHLNIDIDGIPTGDAPLSWAVTEAAVFEALAQIYAHAWDEGHKCGVEDGADEYADSQRECP